MTNLLAYRDNIHDFTKYGLDTTISTPSNRCGCATFIGLLTQYAGLPGYSEWTVDVMMPVVPLTNMPDSVIDVLWDGRVKIINDAVAEFCDPLLHPETAAWGGSGSKSLKFDDPAKLAVWIDNQNNSAPVNGNKRNHLFAASL